MSMKINKLEIENVKRVKAVKIEPRQTDLPLSVAGITRGKHPSWML